MRIQDRQIHRPEEDLQILQVRQDRIARPHPERILLQRPHRSPRPLDKESNGARRRRQQKKRDLLRDQRAHPLPAETLERPEVDEQQHQRKRHQHRLGHQPRGEENQHHRVTPGGPLPDPPSVRPHRAQPEGGAQDVLPLRHPRHRLHVRRMNRKQRRHPEAAQPSSGQIPEDHEEQQGVENVQNQTRRVVTRRVQSEERHVGHVRQPRQRMPVRFVPRREGPLHPGPRQAVADDRVRIHVGVVVEDDELALEHRPQCCERQQSEERREDRLPAGPGDRGGGPERGASLLAGRRSLAPFCGHDRARFRTEGLSPRGQK